MTHTHIASPVDPRDAIKTHVSEMSPAERLAAHDARARQSNSSLPEVEPAAPEAVELTFENLCAVVLDVVKAFALQGYAPVTILPEHVVEKARQRFPDGVNLVGEKPVELLATEPDPLRLDLVKGSDDVEPEDASRVVDAAGGEDLNDDEVENVKAVKKAATKKAAPRRKPAGPSPTPKK